MFSATFQVIVFLSSVLPWSATTEDSIAAEDADYISRAIKTYEMEYRQKKTAIFLEELLAEKNESESHKLISHYFLAWIYSTYSSSNDAPFLEHKSAFKHATAFLFGVTLLSCENHKRNDASWGDIYWLPWVVLASSFADSECFFVAAFCQDIAIFMSKSISDDTERESVQKRLHAIRILYAHRIRLTSIRVCFTRLSEKWADDVIKEAETGGRIPVLAH